MTEPILNKEQEAELKAQRLEGTIMSELRNSRGWQEVIVPKLTIRRESLQATLANASELKEFIKCQQAINAINNLFTFVDSCIALGEQASETLEEARESQRKEIVGENI